MERRWWWWRCTLLRDLILFLFLLLPPKASLASSLGTIEVMVIYEGCREADEIGASLSSPTTHLLRLPCRGASLPSLPTSSIRLSSFPPVVVIASCPVISMVISSLGPNSTFLGGTPPNILSVPFSSSPTCPGRRKFVDAATTPTLHPVERVLNVLLSWMTYHSWKTLTVLHDRPLTHSAFAFFLKRLLADSARVGTRVSFREVPSSASSGEVAEVVGTVVDAWHNSGANHVTVIASEEMIVHLLHVIPGFETEDGESDCDWLIFANAGDSVPREYKPTNGHNVFFADTPLIMTLEERSQAAVRMAKVFAATCSAHQLFQIPNQERQRQKLGKIPVLFHVDPYQ